eukprot:scaffold1658_cov393-Prasinococcus_capsulatus_cf.AAC.25
MHRREGVQVRLHPSNAAVRRRPEGGQGGREGGGGGVCSRRCRRRLGHQAASPGARAGRRGRAAGMPPVAGRFACCRDTLRRMRGGPPQPSRPRLLRRQGEPWTRLCNLCKRARKQLHDAAAMTVGAGPDERMSAFQNQPAQAFQTVGRAMA